MPSAWIPVLVPEEHHAELVTMIEARLKELGFDASLADSVEIRLAAPMTRGAGATSDTSAGDRALAAHLAWGVESLRLLLANTTATAQRWSKALDVCAAEPGEWISTQDIAGRSGLSINEWRDACRKMASHQRKNYLDEAGWPLANIMGRHLGHSYDQLYVAITSEQAGRWAQAKGSDK